MNLWLRHLLVGAAVAVGTSFLACLQAHGAEPVATMLHTCGSGAIAAAVSYAAGALQKSPLG